MSNGIAKTIMVVEDEAIISLIITKTVKRFGYNVISVNTGEKSIETVKSAEEIDLILMDIELGSGIDGTVAAQRILEMREIPIIFHTSHSEREMVEKVKGITRYGYVVKSSGDFVLQSSIEMAFELVEANRKVKENEKHFYELFDLAPLGYQSLDENGIFLEVNSRWLETLGYSRDEVIGRWFGDFLAPEYVDGFRERFTLFKRAGSIHSEFEMLHRNGERRFISFEGRIRYRDDGSVRQTHCILSDITDYKKTENEKETALSSLRVNEQFIKKVMDNLPIGIAVNSVDPDVNFSYINDNFARYYRTSIDALKKPDAFWGAVYEDAEFREVIRRRIIDDCASGDPERMRWSGVPITKSGEETSFISAMNIPLDDNKLMVSIVWDVTADKKAEDTIKSKNQELVHLNDELKGTIEELEGAIDELETSNIQLTIVNRRLADSEEKFRRMFMHHHAVMLLIDPDNGRIVDANLSSVRFYGYTLEQLRRMYIQDINMLPADQVAIERLNAKNESRDFFVFPHRLANSEIKTVEVYSSPVTVEGDILLFSIIHDITPRIKAEEKLRIVEERISAAMNAVDDGIWEWKVDDGTAFFDEKYYRLLGYSDGEFTASYDTWRVLVHPDDLDRVEADLEKSVKRGERFSIDLRMKRRDGGWHWVSTRGKVVEKNISGEAVRMIGTLSDITARKSAELELRRSQQKLERIIENSSELICEIDHEGRYTFVNSRYSDVLGFSPDELIGRFAVENIHPDDMAAAREKYRKIIAGEGRSVDVWRFMHRSGGYRYFECRASVYNDTKGRMNAVIVSHDITESKYLEDTQLFLALGGALILENDFFRSVARFLSKILDMECIFIGKLIRDRMSIKTLVSFVDGVFLDEREYDLGRTPGADVLGKPSCIYPRNVAKLFPDDKNLSGINAESYAGVTLWDSDGKPLGLISAVSRREIDNIHEAESILKMTAFRVVAEMERREADAKIRGLLAEKELLLKEVHHRIKNNMNSVKGLLLLQADSAEGGATVTALNDAVNRIDTMMILYDRLYRSENLTDISAGDYIPALINEIISNFSVKEKIEVNISVDEFMIGVKVLVPLGIIINELISNIMKHAFQGRERGSINVSVTYDGSRAVVRIADDGKGLPEPFDIKKSKGFGMQLVSILIEQIEGDLNIEQKNGTIFTIRFKL